MRNIWRLIAKALGEKTGTTDSEADTIAFIRLVIILQAIATNTMIILGIIKHWSD